MAQRPIDANALKDDILKSAVMIDDRGIQTGYEIAIELIKKQPTIDAEPVRHGKWIEYPIADGMNQCSECGVLRFGESNYCPNCGARMDGCN
jgi:hypothetical protein